VATCWGRCLACTLLLCSRDLTVWPTQTQENEGANKQQNRQPINALQNHTHQLTNQHSLQR
jgi:hypothetical protein